MPGNNTIGVNGSLVPALAAQLANVAHDSRNKPGASDSSANLPTDLSVVRMAPRSCLSDCPVIVKREIASYLDVWQLRALSKACPSFDEITEQELNFRELVKDIASGKKFIDSYMRFEGLEKLSASEMVMMTEVLNGKADVKEEKNNTKILRALGKAYSDSAFRICMAEPPSEENGRIHLQIIRGVPPGHQVAIMRPSLLVTFYDSHSYLFELKNSETGKSMIEAVPCTKYGKNKSAQHIHPGECRAVSANTKVMVLHCPGQDEIKILAEGSEKSFSSRDVAYCRNGEIFSNQIGKCHLSPDGKSLCFLSGKILVRGFSNTPLDPGTFKWESVNLCAYRDNYPYEYERHNIPRPAGGYDIYNMAQSVDYTWAVVCGWDGWAKSELIFLPLPLGSAPFKICEQEIPFDRTGTAILPDNKIAAVCAMKIEIYDSDAKVHAARQDSFCSTDYRYDKIKVSPDGETLAALSDTRFEGGSTLTLYRIPRETSEGRLTPRSDIPTLSPMWSVRLESPEKDYDFIFIDYGSKLALFKRANPSERTILELVDRTVRLLK